MSGDQRISVIDLAGGDWPAALAAATRDLRRAEAGRALLLDGTGRMRLAPGDRRAAADALERVAALPVLTVAALDGPADETALAVALACDHAEAGHGLAIAPSGAAGLLALRVPALLVARAGDAAAHRLLLGAAPIEAAALAAAGVVRVDPDPGAAALAACARALDDPHAGLLRRSLHAATRSTRAQAADFDRELQALIES